MSDVERRFHETWLGMVQPIEGLVVSVPVLVDAQCMERQLPSMQERLLEICPPSRQADAGPEAYRIGNLTHLFQDVLGFAAGSFDAGEALPAELSLYVPEGKQTLRPTMALRRVGDVANASPSDATPASAAGARYEMLVWDLAEDAAGVALDLDKPETVTGTWDYPPAAKLDRLLRHCRVPIGLLTNREVVRLVYAPHGESSGAVTFRLDDMVSVGGRPILDAFIMLLSANRFFGVADERTLPAILAESRKRQANVTNELADQVFEALQILLRGFEAAAERDGRELLDDALAREGDHVYKGLLVVLLRLVFVLYAEDRALLPVDHEAYEKHLSVLALFEELQADHGAYPDSMSRRFGAWGRLVTLFRAIFLGLTHGDLKMPPRRGSLFNPHEYSFLEGWGPAGSAPITQPEDRAEVKLPSLDDETVFRILERLLMFEGQRLSYRALDVEQIGSVYEALMGYHVIRTEAPAVCMRPDRLWVTADEVLAVPPTRRAKWIKETIGLSVAQADKLNEEVSELSGDAALEALAKFAVGRRTELAFSRAKLGQLVLQPGTERRRTSSHYTPRSLSAPIVRRTLEPLLAVMGDAPASERILRLKICDPAMGSGAFLVEACRFLADHVLAAWTREGKVAEIAGAHGDPLLHARRLVAQRCLYGVDKNDAAVELAKLSLWLVTLSKTLPFTFLDHSLRHGDSLVGLDFDQLRAFHWKRPEETKAPAKQLELFGREIAMALDEAIALRQRIGDLGDSADDDREKARLLWDAEDALDRVRLIGDVIVGAFFAHEKDKERERERARREDLVRAWLGTGGPPTEELREMQRELRTRVPVFHWMVEYPEVFYADRPDPLENEYLNRAAYVDGCVVNPPFLSGTRISTALGDRYLSWLLASHPSTHGNADLVVHFLLLGHALLGRHGTLGLVATNTIAQGDSRSSGLAYLLALGAEIYEAWSAREWPGEASVMYCVVHLAVGNARVGQFILDGVRVESLNSSLLPMRERSEPHPLRSMSGLASKGVDTGGEGFVLDRREREALCATDSRNHERIHPYVGGQELNTSPSFDHERWVVNFTGMTLQEAAQFPSLLALVDERVRRPRQALRSTPVNDRLKETWWLYWAPREDFMRDLHSLQRFMAATVYTKHFAISFQRPGRVFNSKVLLIALDGNSHFAVLQSRIHECWARRSSSTLGVGDTLSYSLSDAFVTFPFPHNEPRTPVQSLESIGGCLYGSRANYMEEENVGLTITYNRLKDPTCTEARVLELRALHEEMDRAVTAAYAENDPDGRWSEIEVPPYCPLTHADNRKLEAFENAVIDRLFALNAKRAEDEKLKGLGSRSSKQKKRVTTSEGQPANKAAASPKGAPTSKQLKITDTSES